jgi:hypothetical protein
VTLYKATAKNLTRPPARREARARSLCHEFINLENSITDLDTLSLTRDCRFSRPAAVWMPLPRPQTQFADASRERSLCDWLANRTTGEGAGVGSKIITRAETSSARGSLLLEVHQNPHPNPLPQRNVGEGTDRRSRHQCSAVERILPQSERFSTVSVRERAFGTSYSACYHWRSNATVHLLTSSRWLSFPAWARQWQVVAMPGAFVRPAGLLAVLSACRLGFPPGRLAP